MLESGTSGSVGGEEGNLLAYPASHGVWHASSKHHQGTTMNHYAGIDVSLEESSVCAIDGSGKIVQEGKIFGLRSARRHPVFSKGVSGSWSPGIRAWRRLQMRCCRCVRRCGVNWMASGSACWR